jgi:chromosome segregation ATPase
MKKILFIITLLISLTSFSQKGYPRIEKDTLGNKIVIMTYEQAQKIDNAFELLNLLEKSGVECDSLNLSYIKVIDKLERQVLLFETDIKLYKEQIIDKNDQISNLNKRLMNCESDVRFANEQIGIRDSQIVLLNDEISTLKTKRNIAYGVGIGGTILGILVAILIH